MNILVISPIPSHPQNQGNSARIFSLCRSFQHIGAAIHFVYVTMEGITVESARQMKEAWDFFDVVPSSGRKLSSGVECNLLDDWYEPNLDQFLFELFESRRYDIMFVNYVWFSRAFLIAPSSCYKVLDTHDVFGDRHKRLERDGIMPAWYYTTPQEEGRGLARADLIIAIQDDEATVLRMRTTSPVVVLGHLLAERFQAKPSGGDKIVIGYIASGNPSNLLSLQGLCRSLRRVPSLMQHFDFVLAGPICDICRESEDIFHHLGRYDAVKEFYSEVDVVLNPNIGGTGLKIKSVEALSFGRPLIATKGAMIGIRSDAPEHNLETIDEMVEFINLLSDIDNMAANSRAAFLAYQGEQVKAINNLIHMAAPSPICSTILSQFTA